MACFYASQLTAESSIAIASTNFLSSAKTASLDERDEAGLSASVSDGTVFHDFDCAHENQTASDFFCTPSWNLDASESETVTDYDDGDPWSMIERTHAAAQSRHPHGIACMGSNGCSGDSDRFRDQN